MNLLFQINQGTIQLLSTRVGSITTVIVIECN